MNNFKTLLTNLTFTKSDLINLLKTEGKEKIELFQKAAEVKKNNTDNKVYLRGLIELSNICSKNCFYCGIRKDNRKINRYDLKEDQVLEAAVFAWKNKYGSIVIQAGEINQISFGRRIEKLVKEIKKISNNELGITLSLGEQTFDTYQRWFEAGAHRYLLRIETSNKKLYQKLHPNDPNHDFNRRLQCLYDLKKIGFQTGTGVMIGLPFQTYGHLADDLLFMKEFDIDMAGMGPYIEHEDTPLYQFKKLLLPVEKRLEMGFKMIALLRIMMKDINIAATTALQAIDKFGRKKALDTGANIIMPNITPGNFRNDYTLYQGKPSINENTGGFKSYPEIPSSVKEHEIGYGEWGDSRHFKKNKINPSFFDVATPKK